MLPANLDDTTVDIQLQGTLSGPFGLVSHAAQPPRNAYPLTRAWI